MKSLEKIPDFLEHLKEDLFLSTRSVGSLFMFCVRHLVIKKLGSLAFKVSKVGNKKFCSRSLWKNDDQLIENFSQETTS